MARSKIKISKIQKRDGRIVDFDPERITNVIYKSTEGVGEPNFDLAKELTKKVVENLEKKLPSKKIPTVEEVQDAVEKVLIEAGQARVAKAFILYRQKRAEIRKEKQQILNKTKIDEVDKRFDINALRVLRSRYLKKDEAGKVLESPKQLFERVATHAILPSLFYDKKVSQKRGREHPKEKFKPEKWGGKIKIGDFTLNQFHLEALKRLYDRFNKNRKTKIKFSELLKLLKKGKFDKYQKEIRDYYNLMAERKFMPNTPALANFGKYLGMGSACFALDIDDSIESIMDTLRKATIIFKSGGGVGYNFSKLRPEGDFVKSSGGRASGPISFMTLFDQMTEVIRQGGIRRGANMGILDINHPDIEKFIVAKRGNVALRNFNISVFIKSDFWDYYRKKKPYPLINPRNKEIVKNVDPVTLFDLIVYQGWESAEPGVVFGENINKYNPLLKSLGPIRTTNPCVVGNTLVAVADGRNYVPIKQLAKEKKDVPVYCYGKGKVQIRIGRNPRKTREKVPVWKVTLDDRSHIIATEDHKFRNRNNNEIKLKDLKPGTILMPFYKFQDEQAKGENPDWKISLNNGKVTTEHSLLMEYYQNKILSSQKLSFEVQVSLYNHKVTSVEFYGYEDVYNITVDDFHTVAYITNHNAKTKFTKKPLLSGIITSQCGELPLYGNESCNLGSINVWAFVREKQSNSRKREVGFDWKDFERTIKITTRFLDNVIDVNHYPLPEIEEMTLNTRKMGLGIMGLGDLLYDLEISYNSSEGLDFMERLMEFLNYHSKITSIELAKERGKFPLYDKSFYPERKLPCRGTEERRLWRTGRLDWQKIKEEIKKYGLRNAHTTTNAPTGSISMIAGCSSGIEPVFSLVYEKRITVGSFYYVNPVFERVMMREGLFDEDLIKDISRLNGSCQNINYIPPKFKKIFVTALDLKGEDHIRALAAFQKWTDASISKTINFPAEATIEEMRKGYLLAHKLGCKDLTVFRYKSIPGVLEAGARKEEKKPKKEEKLISLRDVKAKGPSIYREAGVHEVEGPIGQEFEEREKKNSEFCPKCKSPLISVEGCKQCPNCGWSLCAIA